MSEQIYRYWVEICELASGSVRQLPLTAVRKVCLTRGKKNEPPMSDEQALRLEDGAETWEAKSFDELRARVRDKYPDAAFERTLHYVRDREAEERRERVLNELAKVFAEQVVKEMIEEEARAAKAQPPCSNHRQPKPAQR